MWKYLWCPALVLAAGLFYLHCSESPVSPAKSNPPIEVRDPTGILVRSKESVAESANKFGLKLFREINLQETDKNIFISPLSVSIALGMTYNGAAGGTRAAMAQTLELAGLSMQEVNEIYRDMLILLPQLDPNVQLEIANSIWYRDGFGPPKPEFLDICQEYFDALVAGLNFNAPDAASIINAWVEENTHGKIEEIVDDPIRSTIVMFLINAIYFNGTWKYQFNENETADRPFYRADGSTTSCQIMSQRSLFAYYENTDFQILDLPYGNEIFSMTIILPRRHAGLDDLIMQLEPDNLNDWLGCLAVGDSVDVHIPRFTLEYDLLMNDVLRALGMSIAFSGGADFSNMYPGGGVWIGEVKHKAFVDVNERGTEAAAATQVTIEQGMRLIFGADHPFLFMIRENEYNTILFIGKVVDPVSG
jgi:serpin B